MWKKIRNKIAELHRDMLELDDQEIDDFFVEKNGIIDLNVMRGHPVNDMLRFDQLLFANKILDNKCNVELNSYAKQIDWDLISEKDYKCDCKYAMISHLIALRHIKKH